MTAHRVDFVDEDDAGSILLTLLEHVADAGRTNAHEHLDEIRTGNGEERHISFTGNSAGQQGLTRTGRPHQQHAFGDLAAQALEFLRVLEELDDFFQFLLGLVNARHVFKGDAAGLFRQQAGAAFAKAHGLAPARLHLAHEENPHTDQQQHGEPRHQDAPQRRRILGGRLSRNAHARIAQLGHDVGFGRQIRGKLPAIIEMTTDRVPLDGDIGHLSMIHVGH